jgi:A/G-specific adenine glycosylase
VALRRAAPRPFAARLVAWQRKHGRHDLPWQRTRDPYRIWIAEIMLQQTQVATVIPYYERFLAAFPDVNALATAPLDRVLAHWSGLGYYRRAHHLHAAANAIVAQHEGTFPRTQEGLAALPGIGRSTAAAIVAFAYGKRAAILDGNVKRVLARHRGIDGYPGDTAVEAKLWRIADSLLPARTVAPYTQALMDLGATVCTRTKPLCGGCPVADDCVARRSKRVHVLPAPRAKRTLPRREVRVLLLERAGTILLEKRPSRGIWAGLWGLPEVAVDADVAAYCRVRFGARVIAGEPLHAIEHGFTHFRLTLHPQRVLVKTWPARTDSAGLVWLTLEDALAAALPAPIRSLLRTVAEDAEGLAAVARCRTERGTSFQRFVRKMRTRGRA